jgi:hypothetical protein
MENLDFLLISILAFTLVLLILFQLALSIRLLVTVFPEKAKNDDSVVMEAISDHYHKAYKNSRIIKIEEQN